MLRRRRPLLRAAMVGGGAYIAGKRAEQRQQAADQNAPPDEVDGRQAAPAPSAGATPDIYEQLEKLGELRKQGVLTESEFDTQKQKLLQST